MSAETSPTIVEVLRFEELAVGSLASRRAVVRGPMPRSISMIPAGERRSVTLPEEPLARMQSSRDIRVGRLRAIER